MKHTSHTDQPALDAELGRNPPRIAAPSDLHESIMEQVRGVRRVSRERELARGVVSRRLLFRWLPVPALALAMVLGLWFLHRTPEPGSSALHETSGLDSVTAALELGNALAQNMPSAAIRPLEQEWQNLLGDLDWTARFLWASVP